MDGIAIMPGARAQRQHAGSSHDVRHVGFGDLGGERRGCSWRDQYLTVQPYGRVWLGSTA